MRKIAFSVIFFLLLSLPASAQVITQILKRMEAHRKALKSLRASMTTDKFSVQLGGTYTKEGALVLLSQKNGNNAVRIDSTRPETQSFLIVENQYLVYQPNPKIAYTGTATATQKILFFQFSDLSEKALKSEYDIAYLGQEKITGLIPVWHLELLPKAPESYKKIELWIDANGMPLQLKITENNGDWTNVLLSNLQKNVSVNAAEFKIRLPKGTTIVKN